MTTWQQKLNNARKAEGHYGCIAPDGWKNIVLETDEMLNHVDPDYKIAQVKEKYGTLRYYFDSNCDYGSVERKIMDAIIVWAETLSAHTCEHCGKNGKLRTETYYMRTLCDECNKI